MKRFFCLGLILCLLLSCIAFSEPAELRFSDAILLERLKELDGKEVAITGYVATLSPISGEYIYLMNLPYQSCPFCVPNTSQLSNTMAVYAKKGSTFTYTDQAIRVTGILEIGGWTDDFGYEYNYRIRDAVYEIADLSTVSEEYGLWSSIASDGIVGDFNSMLDYVYFCIAWPKYSVSYTDEDGNDVFYYLWAGDAENYLADDSVYGYGSFSADDYFPSLIRRIRAISRTELEDLVGIAEQAERLAARGRQALADEAYEYDEETETFTLDEGTEMEAAFDELYLRFSEWLTGWEL